jgi:DNA-binding response OmpR family regulator
MENIKILYVEDDLTTAENVIEFLEDEKFIVYHTDTIVEALAQVKINSYDIVLLDLNLQDYSGFEFLKNMKKGFHLPVIVISASSETTIKLQAFRYGASDYMVKPIELLELEARIWTVLGRFTQVEVEKSSDVFYEKDGNIFFKNRLLELTPTEYEILKTLMKNKNSIVSREHLVSKLSNVSSTRTLDYHIKNIRSKIEKNDKTNKYLKTVYGTGYKLIF